MLGVFTPFTFSNQKQAGHLTIFSIAPLDNSKGEGLSLLNTPLCLAMSAPSYDELPSLLAQKTTEHPCMDKHVARGGMLHA